MSNQTDSQSCTTGEIEHSGEPFAENVTIWWNFVGHSKEYIATAQQDWHAPNERFGSAPLQEWLANSNRATRMDGPPVPW